MEDNAPPHAHHYQSTICSAFDIELIIWPENLLDLNMIEPCWYYLKRQTTRVWAPTIHNELVEKWKKE